MTSSWVTSKATSTSTSTRAAGWVTPSHAVDALLTADGARERSSHQHRNEILQREQRYQKIFKHFRNLYDLAHQTRYAADSSRWIPAHDVQKRVIEERLFPIESSVRKLLAERKPPIPMAAHEPLRVKGPKTLPA